MSEPVTHTEIEDVLSSIRRLVSENGKGAQAKSPGTASQKSSGRLVLTPALRVATAQEKSEEPTEIQPVAKPLETALGGDPVAPEVAPQSVTDTSQKVKHEEPTHRSPWTDPDARLFDVFSTEQKAPSAGDDVLGSPNAFSRAPEPLRTAPAERMEPEPTTEKSPRVAAVVRKIAELEFAQREDRTADTTRNGAEPLNFNEDDQDSVPPAGPNVETLEWEDHRTPEPKITHDTLDDIADAASARAKKDTMRAVEEVMDETSLRALVADIVREELQGPLGERITRNVRKLVRRELQRALAAQDLI